MANGIPNESSEGEGLNSQSLEKAFEDWRTQNFEGVHFTSEQNKELQRLFFEAAFYKTQREGWRNLYLKQDAILDEMERRVKEVLDIKSNVN